MDSKHLIFISGVGRSGTTLIQSMLNAHPEVALPPETHVVKTYLIPEFLGKKSPANIDECRRVLSEDTHFTRLQPEVLAGIEQRLPETANSYRSLFDAVTEYFCEKSGATFGGDKDTEYVNHIPQLSSLFPGSYFVHIYRDPRDVISSRMKSSWGKGQVFLQHLFEYKYGLNNAVSEGQHCFQERFISLSYERLISNPEQVLRDVCASLNIGYDKRMLQYYVSVGDIVTSDEADWKQNVAKPVITGNSGKWKSYLSPYQTKLIEYFLRDEMMANGYEASQDGGVSLGPLLSPLYPIFIAIKNRRRSS